MDEKSQATATGSLTMAQWLAAEPFTLTMSSGFFGFFAHAGMLSQLVSHQLLPHRLTGSSAGALVAACYASGMDTKQIRSVLFSVKRQDFWDPQLGLGLLAGKRFRKLLGSIFPASQFAECNVPLGLSVFDGQTRQTKVIKQGNLIDAVYASCAVPLLFHPLRHEQGLLWDGGIADRPGLAATKLNERIFYHHISSRSPWRRRGSHALKLPRQSNLLAFAIDGLPRSGPSRLHTGPQIYQLAAAAMGRALVKPLPLNDDNSAQLRVTASVN